MVKLLLHVDALLWPIVADHCVPLSSSLCCSPLKALEYSFWPPFAIPPFFHYSFTLFLYDSSAPFHDHPLAIPLPFFHSTSPHHHSSSDFIHDRTRSCNLTEQKYVNTSTAVDLTTAMIPAKRNLNVRTFSEAVHLVQMVSLDASEIY